MVRVPLLLRFLRWHHYRSLTPEMREKVRDLDRLYDAEHFSR
jgi:hypothetical protein